MPLAFAYGSNLDREAMRARCPASEPIGPARLLGHRFIIMREGYASVVRDPRREVWGLLWNLDLADMPALDRYESLASGLYRKTFLPVVTSAGPRRALVYIARSREPGTPRPRYIATVLAAAQAAGLPPAYLKEIAAWSVEPRASRRLEALPPASAPKVRPLRERPEPDGGIRLHRRGP
jgi:gamma-glutamylcyclotransferase (GGCT)/AIG2-like uncharacterized protein YtfP